MRGGWSVALRSCVQIGWMALTVAPVGIAMVLLAPFLGSHALYAMARFWLVLSTSGARRICGIRYELVGWERIERFGLS